MEIPKIQISEILQWAISAGILLPLIKGTWNFMVGLINTFRFYDDRKKQIEELKTKVITALSNDFNNRGLYRSGIRDATVEYWEKQS